MKKVKKDIDKNNNCFLKFSRTLTFIAAISLSLTACGGGSGGSLPAVAPADETGPVIKSIEPLANEIDVPAGSEANALTTITVTFDEELDQSSVIINNILIEELDSNGNILPATVVEVINLVYTVETNKLVITTAGFIKNKSYQIKIKNLLDIIGNSMTEFNSQFSTTRLPSIVSNIPANNTKSVSTAQKIIIKFDEVMDEISLKNGFTLIETQANATNSTTYKFNDAKLSLLLDHQIINNESFATYSLIDPATQTEKLLAKTSRYTINLSATIADLSGNTLIPTSIIFTTGVSDQVGVIPATPGKVSAVSNVVSNNLQNTITWPVINNMAYNLYVSINDGDYTQVVTSPSPILAVNIQTGATFTDIKVTENLRYKYAVTAMNVVSAGIYGPESLFSISGEVIPSFGSTPLNLVAIAGPNGNVADGTIKINWDAVGSSKFKLYESSDRGLTFNTVLLNNTSLLTYSYTPTTGNDVEYQFGITIVNADKTESAMLKSDIVVPFGALASVTAVPGDKQVTLTWPTWKKVVGVSYSIYVKIGNNATFSPTPITTNVTVGTFVHGSGVVGSQNQPLINGTSYTYGVVTVSTIPNLRTAIQKDSSLVIPLAPRLPPNEPVNISILSGDAKVKLTWDIDNSVPGVVFDYRIFQKSGTETIFTEVALIKAPSIGEAVVLATNNVEHSFQIVAIDTGLEGIRATTTKVIPRLKGSQISAWNHSCVIKAGDIWCWGDNTFGQLGNSTKPISFAEKQVKVAVPTTGRIGTSWIAVAAGGRHTCGIRDTGEMYCWGWANSGVLGIGQVPIGTETISPQLVKTPAALVVEQPPGNQNVNWTQVVAGQFHTCGIHSNASERGQLFCWGNNSSKALGIVQATTSNLITVPEPVILGNDLVNNWIEIQTANRHTCGIRQQVAGSTLWCWGERRDGQIGDGIVNFNLRSAINPTQVVATTVGNSSPDTDWSSVAVGALHTCGVRGLSNTLWCWGNNNIGQLSTQTSEVSQVLPSAKYSPVQESSLASDWIKVFASNDQTCGLKKSGEISCWGKNYSGESGSGSLVSLDFEPRKFIGLPEWSQLALGIDHSCGLKNENSTTPNGVSCWGSAEQFKLGTFTSETATPVQVGTASDWFDVSTSAFNSVFTLGLRGINANNSMYAWGNNTNGDLGISDITIPKVQSPVIEKNGFTWKEISGGRYNACGIKADDTLYCWGNQNYVPMATLTKVATPTQIGLDTWLHVDFGSKQACGIKIDGSLWCWGKSNSGELGAGSVVSSKTTVVNNNNGTTTTTTSPLVIPNKPDTSNLDPNLRSYMIKVIDPIAGIQWTSVNAGNKHTCAIGIVNNVSNLYCWGDNTNGQLGIGVKDDVITRAIATDSIGNITITDTLVERNSLVSIPTKVINPTGVLSWLKVSAGDGISCGLTENPVGTLYCWGDNKYGNGSISNVADIDLVPTLVSNVNQEPWIDISIVFNHACARKSDNINDLTSGTLWCWGQNQFGQLGNGTLDYNNIAIQTTPSKVFIGLPTINTYWKKFSTGSDLTCAVKNDDTLWCWGNNFYGQLGNNNAWRTSATPITFP